MLQLFCIFVQFNNYYCQTSHLIHNCFQCNLNLVFVHVPFSLQYRHLPQHLCQFLSHHHPPRAEEKLKVQEAQVITRKEIEVLTGVKLRYDETSID